MDFSSVHLPTLLAAVGVVVVGIVVAKLLGIL